MKGDPLRVMHAVFSLETGGLENGVVNLCNRLTPEHFSPSICVFRWSAFKPAWTGAALTYWLPDGIGAYHPTLPFRLAGLLRRKPIHTLHMQSLGNAGGKGVTAAKMAGTPLLIHGEHGVMEERSRNLPVQRYLWSKAHQVTSVSEPLANRMASRGRDFPDIRSR